MVKSNSGRIKRLRYLHSQKKYNKIHHVSIAKYQKKYKKMNPQLKKYQMNRYANNRLLVLNRHSDGNKVQCICHGNGCKETRIQKLVAEHVNGKAIHNHQGMSNNTYYLKILKTKPKGINVMCQRCNASKRDGNVCRIHGTKF